MFITPDLKKYGFMRKIDIDIADSDLPNFNIYGKTPVSFYANVSGWYQA